MTKPKGEKKAKAKVQSNAFMKDGKLKEVTIEEFEKILSTSLLVSGATIEGLVRPLYDLYTIAVKAVNAGKLDAAVAATGLLANPIGNIISSVSMFLASVTTKNEAETVKNLLEAYVLANAHGESDIAKACLERVKTVLSPVQFELGQFEAETYECGHCHKRVPAAETKEWRDFRRHMPGTGERTDVPTAVMCPECYTPARGDKAEAEVNALIGQVEETTEL